MILRLLRFRGKGANICTQTHKISRCQSFSSVCKYYKNHTANQQVYVEASGITTDAYQGALKIGIIDWDNIMKWTNENLLLLGDLMSEGKSEQPCSVFNKKLVK